MIDISCLRGLAIAAALVLPAAAGAQSPGPAARAGGTLAEVQKRGVLHCGTNGELPGFSTVDRQGRWSGFDVDLCKAVAVAVLRDANKVKYIPATAVNRFDMLRSGQIDMLARNTTITLQRTAGTGVRFAAVTFFDGQAFVVPKRLNIANLVGLDGRRVCITRGTTYEANTAEWFAQRKLAVTPVLFDTTEATIEAFLSGACDAVTHQSAGLAAAIVATGKAADYLVLPGLISKEPHGPYVRAGDDVWQDVVRWAHNARLEAEELGVSSLNVEQRVRNTTDPATRRLLGLDPGNGKALGLDEEWAVRIIKHVGNYGESYEKYFGTGSPLKFGRGANALWTHGGLLYSLPMR